ncbi:MAG: hypothetical protein LAO21_15920 [Acidobacteriia bacterium]|nr:hypothetical protein [Terriglobia bacterium]
MSKIREIVRIGGNDSAQDESRKFHCSDLEIVRSREGELRASFRGVICLTAPMPGDTSERIHVYCSHDEFFDLIEKLHREVNENPRSQAPAVGY